MSPGLIDEGPLDDDGDDDDDDDEGKEDDDDVEEDDDDDDDDDDAGVKALGNEESDQVMLVFGTMGLDLIWQVMLTNEGNCDDDAENILDAVVVDLMEATTTSSSSSASRNASSKESDMDKLTWRGQRISGL